jgi:hypothetical protein
VFLVLHLVCSPRKIVVHRGNHFIAGFKQELWRDTGFTREAGNLPMR